MSDKFYHTFRNISWQHKVNEAVNEARRDVPMKIKMRLWSAEALNWLQELSSKLALIYTMNPIGTSFDSMWEALELNSSPSQSNYQKLWFWSVEVLNKAIPTTLARHTHRNGIFLLAIDYMLSNNSPVHCSIEVPAWGYEDAFDKVVQAWLEQEGEARWRVTDCHRVYRFSINLPDSYRRDDLFPKLMEYADNIRIDNFQEAVAS